MAGQVLHLFEEHALFQQIRNNGNAERVRRYRLRRISAAASAALSGVGHFWRASLPKSGLLWRTPRISPFCTRLHEANLWENIIVRMSAPRNVLPTTKLGVLATQQRLQFRVAIVPLERPTAGRLVGNARLGH